MKKEKGNKTGTEIVLQGGGKDCPRCGWNTYGYTSETKRWDKGELKSHYPPTKDFCTKCAYMEGDIL